MKTLNKSVLKCLVRLIHPCDIIESSKKSLLG